MVIQVIKTNALVTITKFTSSDMAQFRERYRSGDRNNHIHEARFFVIDETLMQR